MDELSSWRELAVRFSELHNGGLQQMFAIWYPRGYGSAGDTWSLDGCANRDARELFKWTAERGAVLLGHSGGAGSLAYWLDTLRKGSPRFTAQQIGHALEDGSVEMEESGAISNVCFASAEYCDKLETAAIAKREPSAARIEVISDNVREQARAQAYKEHLVEKEKDALRLKDSLASSGAGSTSPPEAKPEAQLDAERSVEREALRDAYMTAFPDIFILDICWAAKQHYREWMRWIAGKLKDGSKPDRSFRAVLASEKRPDEYRKEPRPKEFK